MSRVSYPLSCLVCCPVVADPNGSLPGRAYGVITQLRAMAAIDDDRRRAETAGRRGPRDEAPGYVRRLLETSLDERGRLIEELRGQVGPIGSLIVIREPREAREKDAQIMRSL